MNEDLSRFKPYLRDYCDSVLTPAKHQRGFYLCPLPGCGSGSGPNGTAAFSINPDGIHWKCFSCDRGGDIFDLEAARTGKSLGEATRDVVARYDFFAATEPIKKPAAPVAAPVAPVSHADFYREAHEALLACPEALDYLHGRGIIDKSIERFNLGYSPAWKHSKAPEIVSPTKRIIIPRTDRTYTARLVGKPANDYEGQYIKLVEGAQRDLFNVSALENAGIVWICEGELDAISLYQAGASAVVGIGTISNVGRILEEAKKHPGTCYLLALDNDPVKEGISRGRAAQERLSQGMKAAGLFCLSLDSADVYGGAKDANEAYTTDLHRLVLQVAMSEAKAEEERQEAVDRRESELYARTGAGMLDSFFELVRTREFEPIPTGISDIDRATSGGFTSKTLVLLSGAPGLGKTALAQHITENIAKTGRDILFINLEMSRDQLLARSLSRFVWLEEKIDLSPLEVLRGYLWTDDQRAALLRAAATYKRDIAPRFIYNPDGITNELASILLAMESETARIREQGRPAPIICIDYLQLIDSGNRDPIEGLKQTIYQLKAFAKTNNTVVLAISATNRASNKTGTVDLESGRDTSATEYSGDMMLGLSYTALEDRRKYDTGKTKNGEPVMEEYSLEELRRLRRTAYDLGQNPPPVCNEISLKVLKNRFGEPERRAKLYFDGRHNLYTMAYNGSVPVDVQTPFEASQPGTKVSNKDGPLFRKG